MKAREEKLLEASIFESDDRYVLGFDLPELSPGDLQIDTARGLLVVRARLGGESFRWVGKLPPDSDPRRIDTSYGNGTLTVVIPRGKAERVGKVRP